MGFYQQFTTGKLSKIFPPPNEAAFDAPWHDEVATSPAVDTSSTRKAIDAWKF